ncbi:cation:proton antiporter [Mycolicibacterium alvei]|nr:cation:proton antiporter [Mycolicibacterium alvei]MCV7002550.1 cation:proton antiporter [Mycolicibacterium alvei]
MAGFGFDTLALIAVIGLTGPALAAVPRLRIPVVIGQLLAGIVVGRTGFGIVDHNDPIFTLLANIGFALVMFVVGTHVPVRDTALHTAIPKALLRAVFVGAVAAVLGVVIAHVFGTGHAALYAVVMASSSAALALPVLDGLRLQGPHVLSVTAQIAIADTASIVLLPLVIDIQRAPRAALGALAIAGCAGVLFLVLRAGYARGMRRRVHHYSARHELALELRFSLIFLFGLSALAIATHVSIMLAGFALGLTVSAIGEPRRLARQLFGITDGFFGPLFFVWLGASLQVRELADHPEFVLLGVALGLGAVLAHAVGRLRGQPMAFAVLSAAQLGVPVAAATLGTEQHLLAPGESAALMLGALVTIATTSIAGVFAARVAGEPSERQG